MKSPNKNQVNRIVKSLNKNRSKAIDTFVQAFVAVNAPKDFDYSWIINNCVLCQRTVYEMGKMVDEYWIELRPRPNK